jgi:hypothetical protein
MTRNTPGKMGLRLCILVPVLCLSMLGSCTCATACDGPNVTLSSGNIRAGIPGPTTLMTTPRKATNRSDSVRVTTSTSTYSDDEGVSDPGQDSMHHDTTPLDAAIDQPFITNTAVASASSHGPVTAFSNIDQEIGSAFGRYYFAVEVLEGAPDVELLVVFALEAYRRRQYWLASVSAIAILLKILKSVNIAVKFTQDTSPTNTSGLGTLLQPSHVQEACASIAVFAPSEPTMTTNIFTIFTHSLIASDISHGAVIVPSTGAGTAPHTGHYYTNSTTPSYTVHAVYT